MVTSRRTFLGLATTATALVVLPISVAPRPRLTKARMAELFGDIECWDDRVDRIWLNPVDTADLLPVFGHDLFDRESNRPVLQMGVVGYLWGATVFKDASVPAGYVGMASGAEGIYEDPVRIRSLAFGDRC